MENPNLMEEEWEISSKGTVKVRAVDLDLVINGVSYGIQNAKMASMRLLAASVPQSAQMEWPILGSLAQRSLMHVA